MTAVSNNKNKNYAFEIRFVEDDIVQVFDIAAKRKHDISAEALLPAEYKQEDVLNGQLRFSKLMASNDTEIPVHTPKDMFGYQDEDVPYQHKITTKLSSNRRPTQRHTFFMMGGEPDKMQDEFIYEDENEDDGYDSGTAMSQIQINDKHLSAASSNDTDDCRTLDASETLCSSSSNDRHSATFDDACSTTMASSASNRSSIITAQQEVQKRNSLILSPQEQQDISWQHQNISISELPLPPNHIIHQAVSEEIPIPPVPVLPDQQSQPALPAVALVKPEPAQLTVDSTTPANMSFHEPNINNNGNENQRQSQQQASIKKPKRSCGCIIS